MTMLLLALWRRLGGRAGAVVLAVMAAAMCSAGLYLWGVHTGTARAEAAHQAKASRSALRAAEQRLADQAAAQAQADALARQLARSQHALTRLQQEMAHVPTVVHAPAPDGAALAAPAGPAAAEGADGEQLSLAAVRLWNSALAGADVPAGACGAAAAPAAACAAGAGIGLGQLHANGLDNAQRCSACRQQLDALITLLEQQQRTAATDPATHPATTDTTP
jgi:uncharacterized protein HemX